MNAKAYVLIEIEAGQTSEVVMALSELAGVRSVDAITGPYDVIATVETADQRALAVWHEHVPSSDVGHAGEESAAWHAYTQMLADHGDDF